MLERNLLKKLEQKSADKKRLAANVVKHPELVSCLVSGLEAEKPAVRFGCARLLHLVSETNPEIIYPRIDRVLPLLASPSKIMKWGGIHALGNLARVDSVGLIDKVLGAYLEPIKGPDLVTAANVIGGAAKIARAKPRLSDTIVRAILLAEKGKYRTPACRDVALGKAIEALDLIYSQTDEQKAVEGLVRRQLKNKRGATRKKAESFVKRWLSTDPKRRPSSRRIK